MSSLLLFAATAPQVHAALQPLDIKIDTQRVMGSWFVQRAIPAVSLLEKAAHNGREDYSWDGEKIDVTYTFNAGAFDGKMRTVRQRGSVANEQGTQWTVSPVVGGFAPLKLPFLIIDIDAEDYSYLTCSGGPGSWMYILTREQKADPALMERLLARVEECGFDMSKVLVMPHGPALSP